MTKIRSNNNNVFHYSSYWHSWSRILFHDSYGDSRGSQEMRTNYKLPASARTIEVNVYDRTQSSMGRNVKVVVRSHCTAFDRSDKLTMELPQDISDAVTMSYEPDVHFLILHADLLKYIDYNKLTGPKNNGGCELADCLIGDLTIQGLHVKLLADK